MSDKLNIANEMRQLDTKNRQFWDELTDEERKKFSTFLMLRWGSSVEGSQDLQEFYVIATNERLNKHFFNVGRHPKLQWLMATSISPGMGTHRHTWISPKKREAGLSAKKKRLQEIYPTYRDDELDVMAAIVSSKELDEYDRAAGKDKK
jgi:hypothetical protein